jgi:glycosyltransferase involved in cell wall biosynthesis
LPVFLKDSQYGEFKTGAGPEEFFNLIDNAEIVLTDSFHGVIFSSICGKPFYVFERFKSQDKLSQNSRVYNFLEMIDLSDKLIGYNDDVKGEYTFNVDYTAPKKTIAYERKKSLDYLKNSLYTENPLVSIIVPVYNVEKYIKQCLDSISAQTYQNIEIIVVDDGTPDDSGKIADECAGKDDRVKVIHQENGGISRARNAGYDMATGEYIVFVDSDDAIAPDYVEYMLGLIENTGTDIARVKDRFDYRNFDQVESDKFERVPSVEILKNMEYHHDGIEVWNKIYRKSFLEKNKIRHFDEIEFGEGMTFNAYALLHTDFIGVGRRRVYYYRHNFDSAVRKFVWDDRRKTLAIALDYRGKFFAESGNKTLQKALEYHIWLNAFYFYRGLLSLDDPKQQQDLAKYYHLCRTKISGVMLADKSKISKKGIIKAILIFLSPKIMAILINKREREINQDLLKKVNKGVFNLDKMPWENPKPKIRRKHWINHHLGIKGCIKLILIKLLPYKIQRLIRGKQ